MAKSEIETVINWTAVDEEAVVYSLMPRIWRMCEKAGGRLVRSGDRDGREAWREYAVPVRCVSIRAKRVLSDAQRQVLRDQIAGKRVCARSRNATF